MRAADIAKPDVGAGRACSLGHAGGKVLGLLTVLALLSGCALLLNDARRIRAPSDVPSDRAVIILGVVGDGLAGRSVSVPQLDQFSLETGTITGNCGRYNRLESSALVVDGIAYHAFDAPPGYYVISPFSYMIPVGEGGAKVDSSAVIALRAPAGVVTYFGDFHLGFRQLHSDEKGNPSAGMTITYRLSEENLRGAAVFASSTGIRGTPVRASTQPVDGFGPPFLCAP